MEWRISRSEAYGKVRLAYLHEAFVSALGEGRASHSDE